MHTAPVNGAPTCERIAAKTGVHKASHAIYMGLKKLEGYATQLEAYAGVVALGFLKVCLSLFRST